MSIDFHPLELDIVSSSESKHPKLALLVLALWFGVCNEVESLLITTFVKFGSSSYVAYTLRATLVPETSIDRVAVPRDRTHTITIIKWENRSLYHFGGIGRILNYFFAGYS